MSRENMNMVYWARLSLSLSLFIIIEVKLTLPHVFKASKSKETTAINQSINQSIKHL